MSTMTLEQVRDRLRNDGSPEWCIPNAATCEQLADAIDAHLREREAAKAGVTDALDYVPGELDKTAPERIWLQIDTAASNNDRKEPWPGCDDVTWQDESVGGLEIKYVRADLAVPMLASARPIDAETVLDEYVRICAAEHAEHAMAADRVDAMRRALAHAGAASARVPDGYQLVPIEPTESQIKAMTCEWFKSKDGHFMRTTTAMRIYFAMLAAAPKRGGGVRGE